MSSTSAAEAKTMGVLNKRIELLRLIPTWAENPDNIPDNLSISKTVLASLTASLSETQEDIKKWCDTLIDVLSSEYSAPLLNIIQETLSQHKLFLRSLSDVGISAAKDMPYICRSPDDDPGKLRVYPKVVIDGASPVGSTDYIAPTLTQIVDAMKDESKRQAWSPMERGLRSLSKYDLMTIERVMTRYVVGEDSEHSASHIEKLAVKVADAFAPLRLEIAETPERCAHIYENNAKISSCMCRRSGEARHWEDEYDKDKFHPVMFYGDHPELSVAGLFKGAKVLARAAVITSKKEYGRIFALSGTYSGRMKDELEAAGYTKTSKQFVSKTKDWEVPYREGRFPMVYFDYPFEGYNVYVCGFPKENIFRVSSKPKKGYTRVQSATRGVHHAAEIGSGKSILCGECGDDISHDMLTECAALDGYGYCSRSCARDDNHRIVRRADNTRRIVPMVSSHYYHRGTYYSSKYAFEKLTKEGLR